MFEMEDRVSFGFSAENPTGTKEGGTRGKDCDKLSACISIAPGATVTLMETEKEGMITHMWFTGSMNHHMILRAYWEGEEFPSVEAPISALFGRAYDENLYDRDGRCPELNSALILASPGCSFNSYFELPFRKKAKITVENRGNEPLTLYYMISGWYGKVPENKGWFHAAYRQEHPVTKGSAYEILGGVKGEGLFAGLILYAGMNGTNSCWVEGEAKMYLDGDRYPTMNYTGTEDYFCGSYAFGNDIGLHRYQTFSGLYCGLYAILGDDQAAQYNQQKRFMLYRFHVTDPVYFKKDFRMTIDNLGWTGPRYDDYTSVAFWYQTKPCPVPYALPSDDELCMK